jgi:glutathione synthase/RimK-type ligase-like ATP-grasp enzyme
MILIITHKQDYTADFVINKLNKQKIAYKRLNCEDILLKDFSLSLENEYKYDLLEESKYSSVWFRRTKLPEIHGLDGADKMYVLDEIDSFFKNLFTSIPSKWLSLPSSVYEAENKILQLRIAKEIGFNVPATLITNSKERLTRFYDECGGEMILKPISQTRIQYGKSASFIFTNPVTSEVMERINEYDLTPCIYQKKIEKEYEIRITVIENEVFSAAVYSQTDEQTKNDWRKKKLDFHKVEIPNDLKEKCISIVKRLNLGFGAIDIIKSVDDNYYFLEINPNGQWAWIETQTGQDISGAIIRYLTN